jgi:FeS assembly SUF system protein
MKKMPEPILPPEEGLNTIQRSLLEGEVIEAIREVYDPEIPVNVYDLGLIYGVLVSPHAEVDITMTLTNPACPVADILPGQVEAAAASVPGVKRATVELVWDPPFTLDRVPEHIRLDLGLL